MPRIDWTLYQYNAISDQTRLLTIMDGNILHNILKKLHKPELNKLMTDPMYREKSFLNWPYKKSTNLGNDKMAKAGFYYLGDRDLVICPYCMCKIHRWDRDDDPIEEHKVLSSFTCNFIKDKIYLNPLSYKPGDSELVNFNRYDNSTKNFELGISTTRAVNYTFKTYTKRLDSFRRWMHNNPAIKSLANAGFYSQPTSSRRDQVKCFYCGGVIYDWDWVGDDRCPTDQDMVNRGLGADFVKIKDPLIIHIKAFPNCELMAKYRYGARTDDKIMYEICSDLGYDKDDIENVGNVKTIGLMIEKLNEMSPALYMKTSSNICCGGIKTHIALPCGHMLCCDYCDKNNKIEKCFCGKSVAGSFRVYT